MHSTVLAASLLAALGTAVAHAQDAVPMNKQDLDPAELKAFYGRWDIRDESGKKRCRVVLKEEDTIGGSEIEVSPKCIKLFPVMEEITAWRLMEGWEIDLVDALRKTRIRFSTPDDRYVAFPETDGIFSIDQATTK
jgi:hypothetical protein